MGRRIAPRDRRVRDRVGDFTERQIAHLGASCYHFDSQRILGCFMELFVGNLPTGINVSELERFFGRLAKNAEIQLIHLDHGDRELVYAHVIMPSERLGNKAIKKLNAKLLDGHHVIVREYVYRAGNNDRRALNWRLRPWAKDERRDNERRVKRKEIAMEDEFEPEYTGYANLSQKF